MLKCSLCDYSDAHILVKGKITVTGAEVKERELMSKKLVNIFLFLLL